MNADTYKIEYDDLGVVIKIAKLNSDSHKNNWVGVKNEGVTASCFGEVDPCLLESIYMYVMTVTEDRKIHESELSTSIIDYENKVKKLDEGRDRLREELQKERAHFFLSQDFIPGFYGIPVEATKSICSVVGAEDIGVKVNDSAMMIPEMSCCGMFFLMNNEESLPEIGCEKCSANKSNCKLCRGSNKENTSSDVGVAVDIGTTTVVCSLYELDSGSKIGEDAATNPQSFVGGNIISRISFASQSKDNERHLQRIIINCINAVVKKIMEDKDVDDSRIKKYVLVGNTAMCHFLLGESTENLAVSPFSPAYTGHVEGSCRSLGLMGSGDSRYYVVSGIGGHVGSDITAGIIETGLMSEEKTVLFLDVGTNGEVVLKHGDKILACSTAAGPAFEGASIFAGMRAVTGAIDGIWLERTQVKFTVIGDVNPMGICGSGIIDGTAEMLRKGIIDETGRILFTAEYAKKYNNYTMANRIFEKDGDKNFLITTPIRGLPITIHQQDIREVQMAKAAIAAGIMTLLEKVDIKVHNIDKLILTGAFGSHINVENAQKIGLIPDVELSKVETVHNAAARGAAKVLLSKEWAGQSELVYNVIEHVDLGNSQLFQEKYIEEMDFKK